MGFAYPDAVASICTEIREDLVSNLATLVDSVGQYTGAYATYCIIDKLQVRCSELCAQGLDYQTANAFAMRFFGPDAQRWLDDDLWNPLPGDQEPQHDE